MGHAATWASRRLRCGRRRSRRLLGLRCRRGLLLLLLRGCGRLRDVGSERARLAIVETFGALLLTLRDVASKFSLVAAASGAWMRSLSRSSVTRNNIAYKELTTSELRGTTNFGSRNSGLATFDAFGVATCELFGVATCELFGASTCIDLVLLPPRPRPRPRLTLLVRVPIPILASLFHSTSPPPKLEVDVFLAAVLLDVGLSRCAAASRDARSASR